MLADFDTEKPHYLGAHYLFNVEPNGFNQGGAGYVLSRNSLKKLVTQVQLFSSNIAQKNHQGSILPKFDFTCFPILAVKLECLC